MKNLMRKTVIAIAALTLAALSAAACGPKNPQPCGCCIIVCALPSCGWDCSFCKGGKCDEASSSTPGDVGGSSAEGAGGAP